MIKNENKRVSITIPNWLYSQLKEKNVNITSTCYKALIEETVKITEKSKWEKWINDSEE